MELGTQGLEARLGVETPKDEPVVTERRAIDVTRVWPRLPTGKQKEVKLCLEHTVKLSLFCEGIKSRRTPEAQEQRQEKAVKRWQEKPWRST